MALAWQSAPLFFGLLRLATTISDSDPNLPFDAFEPNYAEAIKLSLLFYEAQRSGHLPADNRISWRGDSALEDHGERGEDLSGGYYDASDFVKFGFTMAFSTSVFGWGLLLYRDVFERIGEHQRALEAVKWATDYFLKCHVSEHEFYGQVGDFYTDHKYWGRPEELNMTRPAYKIDPDHPGSDLAAETAASLAIGSLIFESVNRTYAQELRKHAEELYAFGIEHKGYFYKNMPGYNSYYENAEYEDELAWAAIWLFKATNNSKYLRDSVELYQSFDLQNASDHFWFDTKTPGLQLLLALETNETRYKEDVEKFCNFSMRDQKRTPKGLVFIDPYGTLAYAANIAFICLKALDFSSNPRENYEFAKSQIDYMLGSTGPSFVVGYGSDYPNRPHHAASSCPNRPQPCGWNDFKSAKPNPQILYGALVSGPLENDLYKDQRFEFLYNQVTIDYNAGFQGVLAGLLHYQNLTIPGEN